MTSDLPVASSANLRRAGSHLVAAVYALAGHRVSWPLEPAPYDLLVDPADGSPIVRVQVKTCTSQQDGQWVCWITRSAYCGDARGKQRVAYNAGDVDVLGIVDGDHAVYLVPFALVRSQKTVRPRAYERYRAAVLTMPGEPQRGLPAAVPHR